jgi:hypothetical protein
LVLKSFVCALNVESSQFLVRLTMFPSMKVL